jgi:NADH:ubiquinone oxidoreductase subunit 5 (subunit L)/multisubunit Na+/H+ antiporter MnhA subunit
LVFEKRLLEETNTKMNGENVLLMSVFVPLLGAFILPLVGAGSIRLRNLLALVFVLVSLVASIIALPVAVGGDPFSYKLSLPLGLSFGFLGDGLAAFMAIVSSLVGAIIVYYSFGYISHYKNQNEYYLMVVLFLGSMMGLVYSTNLIFLYLFWEISAICCWRLIGFFREKEYVLRADKAFLITVAGALMMLLGFIMIYQQTGTFDLTEMKGVRISNAAVILILFGIFSKSATLPLHTWLADAGVAPSPVTSLLHAAVLVKIGVYVFARLFLINFSFDEIWHTVVPIIAAVSALVSAGAALVETDLKRIIAFSTVSQIGFIFLGLSCGSAIGAAGGLLYIMMHGIAKGGLFLCAGIVEQNAGTKDIRKLGGLITTMPVTAVAFIICAFSVMGIPPFGGFFAKYMVIGGAVYAGQPWIAFTFMIGAVLTVLYLMRAFIKVFLGEPKMPEIKEGSLSMLVSVSLLGVLSVVSGIFINIPSKYVEIIIQQMVVNIR